MRKSSSSIICASFSTIFFLNLFASGTNASVIPISSAPALNDYRPLIEGHRPGKTTDESVTELPNSFTLIVPEGMLRFENGTSLLRGKMHQRFHRDKREACKSRPEKEVMVYYDLKLPNRCWNDCDCVAGRYCTNHSWCHDLPKQ